jgi:hypothetical protein
MFEVLLIYPKVLARHQAGPAAVDRERYLAHPLAKALHTESCCAFAGTAHRRRADRREAPVPIPPVIPPRPTFCALALTSIRSELGLGTCPWRPQMSMPRSTSRQKPEPWRVRGCRHQRGPSAPAGSARADGLPRLAVAILLCGVQKPPPGLGGHLRC